MLSRRSIVIGTSSFLACALAGHRRALADDTDPVIVAVQSAMFSVDPEHPTDLLSFLESQVEGPVFDTSGNVITTGGTWSVNKGFAILDINKRPGISEIASTDFGDVVFPKRPGIYQVGDTTIRVDNALPGNVREIAFCNSASTGSFSMSDGMHHPDFISTACKASLKSGDQMVAWHPPMMVRKNNRTVKAMHVTVVTLLGEVFPDSCICNDADNETRQG